MPEAPPPDVHGRDAGGEIVAFGVDVAENSSMAEDAAPEREGYLRRVLDALEQGRIEPYEYTRSVLAINAASTTQEMAAVADRAWSPAPDDAAAGAPPARALDPVDLALMRTRGAAALAPPRPRARTVSLAIVFALFAVLIAVGLWLAVHVHDSGSAPAGMLVGALVLHRSRR
ncbi:MAG: hypothetical protein ABSG81_01005 [Acidimicrobiales bacterium]